LVTHKKLFEVLLLYQQKIHTMVKNIEVSEFKELMTQENAVIIDVRSLSEKAEGDIPGCVTIDIYGPNFANEIEKLDKDKTYLMFCRSGGRSGSACGFMDSKGFTNVYNLNGGIMAWNRGTM
jgi:rhodanese-related sulfurtransferase